MELRGEQPHLRLCDAQGAFIALFPLSECESFLAAWQGREAFWTGVDVWGERLHIKLAIVAVACERTAGVLSLMEAERVEAKSREMISGDMP